jgi:peptide/nickel transport system ATP-binding protein
LKTKEDFRGIPGLTPSLLAPPPGCMFHPRCPQAMPRCSVDVPVLEEVQPDRWVSCHLFDGVTHP